MTTATSSSVCATVPVGRSGQSRERHRDEQVRLCLAHHAALHPSSPYSCCYLRSAWPSPPSAVAGAARGTTSLHARHDIGPASQHTHWHTPHPTPPPLRAWGVQRGDCERVRPCIAPDRDRAPPPFLLADGQVAVLDAKLLFESRADRSRPWFAGAHFVSGLRVLKGIKTRDRRRASWRVYHVIV